MGKRLPVLLFLVISVLCTACNTQGDITDIPIESDGIFDAEGTVLLPDLTQELSEQTLPKSVVSVIEAYDAGDYTGIWHRCPGMPSGWRMYGILMRMAHLYSLTTRWMLPAGKEL